MACSRAESRSGIALEGRSPKWRRYFFGDGICGVIGVYTHPLVEVPGGGQLTCACAMPTNAKIVSMPSVRAAMSGFSIVVTPSLTIQSRNRRHATSFASLAAREFSWGRIKRGVGESAVDS